MAWPFRTALPLVIPIAVAACATIPNRPPRLAHSSYGCIEAVRYQKIPEGLPDKLAHCIAAGLIARYCSVSEAYLAGAGKEGRDLFAGGDAQWSDWRADRVGIDCARHARDDDAVAACCKSRIATPHTAPAHNGSSDRSHGPAPAR